MKNQNLPIAVLLGDPSGISIQDVSKQKLRADAKDLDAGFSHVDRSTERCLELLLEPLVMFRAGPVRSATAAD